MDTRQKASDFIRANGRWADTRPNTMTDAQHNQFKAGMVNDTATTIGDQTIEEVMARGRGAIIAANLRAQEAGVERERLAVADRERQVAEARDAEAQREAARIAALPNAPPAPARVIVQWAGTTTSKTALLVATKDLKATGFTAAALNAAYNNRVVRSNVDTSGFEFVEVIRVGADLAAAWAKIAGLSSGTLSICCISPHLSEQTITEPKLFARTQRMTMKSAGVDVTVWYMDAVATLCKNPEQLFAYRTCHWLLAILTSNVKGHFLGQSAAPTSNGRLTRAVEDASTAHVEKIDNAAAKGWAKTSLKATVAWANANPDSVRTIAAAIDNKFRGAKFNV